MISAESRPRLAAKARLRHDRRTNRLMILFPEKGLELSPTAGDIVRLCTGENTVGEIVDQLAARYAGSDRSVVEREVVELLSSLAERCLIESTT